ncbi:2-hydroxy-6-oxohepta-2,4-dienoate hydrolase [filamentous cyanobacterium CCP5]|nr:2-hydroxy-6-oxohepta-2,4-dienoate hydrolase [filamentous cyanobacterium CCP5]
MLPEFLPPTVDLLTESTSIQLAAQMRQEPVQTSPEQVVQTSFVQAGSGVPVLLLHGFDSSVFEFRRLLPLLSPQIEAWAVDMLGFGFTERPATQITPATIKQHLYGFWQQFIQRPMVLVGASMGGAAAIDFALEHPEAVSHLVLLDSAGFAAGPAMGALMVPPLDRLATGFLRNPWVRRKISEQAYCDRRYVTPDAELCAALHLECSGWSQALIAFTKSGGYNFLQNRIAEITCPTLIVWGRQDRILGTKDARRFEQVISDSQLVWIDNCGHVPHLEAPEAAAGAILHYLGLEAD